MLWWLTSKWENTIPTITSDFPMVSKMGLFHKSCYEQIKSNGVYAFTHTVSLFSLSLSLYSSVFAKSREVSTLSYEWTPVNTILWMNTSHMFCVDTASTHQKTIQKQNCSLCHSHKHCFSKEFCFEQPQFNDNNLVSRPSKHWSKNHTDMHRTSLDVRYRCQV